MNERIARVPMVVLTIAAVVLLPSCGGDTPEASSPPFDESVAAASAAPGVRRDGTIDWAQVPDAGSQAAMGAFILLTRHLNVWHNGSPSVIDLHISADGTVTDGHGNSIHVPLDEWKAMVVFTRARPASEYPAGTTPMLSPSSDVGDGLGVMPKKMIYEITVVDDDELRFVCRGEYRRQ